MIDLSLPIAVIGAGPVGLAAAAHLISRGETPIVFERGADVAASIQEWAHVRLFSPWRITLDKVSVAMLEAVGWQSPDLDAIPTGGDLITEYLRPLAALPSIAAQLRLNMRVTAVSRYRADKLKDSGRDDMPFVVRFQQGNGNEDQILVKAVIDASGTWTNANPLGANGLPALGEKANAAHIFYGIPDILGSAYNRYANKRVMVVGGGHSAINALLELGDILDRAPNTQIVWVMRTANVAEAYGGLDDDELPARGKLGQRIKAMVEANRLTVRTPFYVQKIQAIEGGMLVSGETANGTDSITVDEIITATGFRPDFSFISELRLGLDSSLETTPIMAPLIDPNVHSCGSVRPHGERELRHPESGFYMVGMKSYGRAPTFLLAIGYEQVRSVVAALVGDWKGAEEVQLELPETGVCCTDSVGENACGTSVQSAPISFSNVIRLDSIPVSSSGAATALQAVSLTKVDNSTCGCGDSCCADGVRSSTCGCDTGCCA
jgi:thioredoxin reductase